MRHVVMFSGGAGSWAAAKRVAEKHGTSDLVLLFSDTLTEDEDLYRFLIEGAANVWNTHNYPAAAVSDLLDMCRNLPEWGTPEYRTAVAGVGAVAVQRLPFLAWIAKGLDIWQVFEESRFLGNTRIDPCSRVLKRELCRAWLERFCHPADTMVYLGYDWTEMNRVERAAPFWHPWQVASPMTEQPYMDKDAVLDWLQRDGIDHPRLYKMGLPHNNCGGGCVKAGIAHFKQLLTVFPERFKAWEAKEQQFRDFIDKDVSILRDRSSAAKCKTCHGSGGRNVEQRTPEPVCVEPLPDGGTVAAYTPKPPAVQTVWEACPDCEGTGRATRPLTLRQLREQTLIQPGLFDSDDWGGCGCFTAMEGAE